MTAQEALFEYTLRMADDSLILGQRLSEWCGHGPILEEDIALTNIALDLIGQATNLYEYASGLDREKRTPDQLAFLRLEHQYKNLLLCEQPNGDYAQTMLRQFFFDVFRKELLEAMCSSADTQLAAIAEKSLKETKYHLKHSSEWVIRMGDGTEESNQRIKAAIEQLWRFVDELFEQDEIQNLMLQAQIAPDLEILKQAWFKRVQDIFEEATLQMPEHTGSRSGGRKGLHTEHLGYLLAEMQYMQRAYPNMEW